MTVNASSLTRISVDSSGTSANNIATGGVMSADGRYVVFQSTATNLVGGDANGVFDVFLRDTLTGTTTLISTATGGTQGNNVSSVAAITDDGRYVFFNSSATNLVGGDTNAGLDVFMRDTLTGVTTRVSTTSAGGEANGASQNVDVTGNGAFIGFQSTATNLVAGDSNGFSDAFVKNLSTGAVTRISVADDESQGNGNSLVTRLSDDGNRASFVSTASNLTANDSNGAVTDVFVRDIGAGTTTLVSVSTGGGSGDGQSSGASISGNGRYVVFQSDATNLVAGDSNGATDIFVRDLQTNTTTRVSTAGDGSQANDLSIQAVISADGRYVVFLSNASNLVQGDTNGLRDIFLKDMVTGTVTRLSVAADGSQLNDLSNTPSISADGRTVTFQTQATNTGVGAEGNGTGFDVFRISLVASAGADRMLGSDGNDTIDGLAGDDILLGGFGNDVLTGGAGADQISGADGTDTASYAASAAGVVVDLVVGTGTGGDAQGDTLSGIENLTGSAHADRLYGNGSANSLVGGAGDDQLRGGAGADILNGGDGSDFANYQGSAAGVVVNLLADSASGGDAQGDQLDSIENLYGSSHDDQLTGDNARNILGGELGNDTLAGNGGDDVLSGEAGNDTLDGGDGNDRLVGGAGADIIHGGIGNDSVDAGSENDQVFGDAGDDVLLGGTGDDQLDGGAGNDLLEGAGGADVLTGGAGIDTVSYAGSSAGVTVDLATGAASGGDAAGDSFSGIEQLLGSASNDVLTGDVGANTLWGMAGDDVLTGGAGADVLKGGAGNDRFVYTAIGDSTVAAAGRDVISNFAAGDKIDLSGIDADGSSGNGDTAFTFGTGNFTGVAGQLRVVDFGDGRQGVYLDVDGDKTQDSIITVYSDHALTASDFVL
ncbi:beta strand repeat-containing protein [Inquilinus sp. NPDC058860]|uniref:beta strand repeat-containing protein n=1 Tax=Inquilinus sp. NPDC058860 TaxID=3346652 RepID=UPI0036B6D580